MKCPYCERPLGTAGVWCHACRRYVLRWPHMVMLFVLAFAAVITLLEIFSDTF